MLLLLIITVAAFFIFPPFGWFMLFMVLLFMVSLPKTGDRYWSIKDRKFKKRGE